VQPEPDDAASRFDELLRHLRGGRRRDRKFRAKDAK